MSCGAPLLREYGLRKTIAKLRFRLERGDVNSRHNYFQCLLGIHEPLRDVLYDMSFCSYKKGSMINEAIRDRKRSSQ
jgi:hypothetical protein